MSERDGIFAGDNPFEIARAWLAEATHTEINDPNAMALATVDAQGVPDVRIVLLKEIEDDGFVFYTNYESAKAQQMDVNPHAAVVLHWKTLRRQIRIRGSIEKVSSEQSDAYFYSRALESRLGAWASSQSRPLESRDTLMERHLKIAEQFGDAPPRPEHWGGLKLRPLQIEFWHDGAHRLHDRFCWKRSNIDKIWEILRLYP